MWLMTPIGFFSIVQKAADAARGTLTVRARVRGDLEALRQQHLPGLGEIEESTHSDYRFRAVGSRAEVAAAMAALVAQIDYNNFKSEVSRLQGPERAEAYQNVWQILYRLQSSAAGTRPGVAKPSPVTLTRKAYHARKDEQGRPVLLSRPSVPSSPASWNDPTQVAQVIPKSWMPAEVNGIAIASWSAAPVDEAGWTALAAAEPVSEPPWAAGPGDAAAAATVVLEADGRIWLIAPSNAMGGSHTTFPRTAVTPQLAAQAAALKGGYLATGLQLRLQRHLIDVTDAQGSTRYYLAERLGGNPADMGWTSQAVLLMPLISLTDALDNPRDLPVVEALLGRS